MQSVVLALRIHHLLFSTQIIAQVLKVWQDDLLAFHDKGKNTPFSLIPELLASLSKRETEMRAVIPLSSPLLENVFS